MRRSACFYAEPTSTPAPLARTLTFSQTNLPITEVLDDVVAALGTARRVVVEAPPGAGKTTLVPLAVAASPWCAGKVLVLEPRRVAARAAARRMATLVGDRVGGYVGHRMRDDTRVGSSTRIEVVTEGVLVRMLHADPSLEGVACVLFDEFHERSLDAELGLALTLDAASVLRDDLAVGVMSATLDGLAIAELLGAPVVTSEGRAHPVEIRWSPVADARRWEDAIASAVTTALVSSEGDVLVFLPGAAEIGRAQRRLTDCGVLQDGVVVRGLHGQLPGHEQDLALLPDLEGRRKVILATSVAETSLTIEGVRAVVDSGWSRVPVYDARRGVGGLRTVRVAKSSATQRAGRAGRTAPGWCWRMWSEGEHATLAAHPAAEITQADLVPLAVDLARWGTDETDLAWLTPPPAPALAEARALLSDLDVLTPGKAGGVLTQHGHLVAALPAHPRLAHAIVRACAHGGISMGALACDLAAATEAGRRPSSTDAAEMVRDLSPDVARSASRLRTAAGLDRHGRGKANEVGLVLGWAYPDRLAVRRGPEPAAGDRQAVGYRLANGSGAILPAGDPLGRSRLLAVGELFHRPGEAEATIVTAAPLDDADLALVAGDDITDVDVIAWERAKATPVAIRQRRLGALVLSSGPIANLPPGAYGLALCDGVRQEGLKILPWSDTARRWRDRVAFLNRVLGDGVGSVQGWPDVKDEALLERLEEWLAPSLMGASRRRDLDAIDVAVALRRLLPHHLACELDRLAPTHLNGPTGARVRIDYSGERPTAALRIQQVFGWTASPTVADGRVPVVLELLTPANRLAQVTADLAGFWAGSYSAVRAELRGRYPKHPWPENPTLDDATDRVRRHRGAAYRT